MSGLARMLHERGATCTGSDGTPSELTESLRDGGIPISYDQSAAQLPGSCDLIIASAAIQPDHPELLAALERGMSVMSYSEALGMLQKDRTAVCLAGTHGKSTTSAILCHVLLEVGLDPSFIIGATCPQIGGGSRVGAATISDGPLTGRPGVLVCEACEFNRSFHHHRPTIGLVNNIEEDHLDIYGSLDAVIEAFADFARLLPAEKDGGRLLIAHDEAHRREVASGLTCKVETFGFHPEADYHVAYDPATCEVSIERDGERLGAWTITMPGAHMAQNYAAAAILSHWLGADWTRIPAALQGFAGLDRRMQRLGARAVENGEVVVYDDYGHHPTEIEKTLKALRDAESPPATDLRLSAPPAQPDPISDGAVRGKFLQRRRSDRAAYLFRPRFGDREDQSERPRPRRSPARPRRFGQAPVSVRGDHRLSRVRVSRWRPRGHHGRGAGVAGGPTVLRGRVAMLSPSASTLFADLDVEVTPDAPIGPMSWYGIGGRADLLVKPLTVDALATLVKRSVHHPMSIRVFGQGANLLVADEGVGGLVISLDTPAFREVTYNSSGDVHTMRAMAGADLAKTLMDTTRRGLEGLSQMAGIPASIGGAIRMNAGGRFGSIGDVVETVTCLTATGELVTYPIAEIEFEYRQTNLSDPIIIAATFRVEPTDPIALRNRVKEIFAFKKSTQPLGDHSAGCTFKNPLDAESGERVPAGRLIDEAGLKGHRVGGASVSTHHANFIVADSSATADDVLHLLDDIRRRVFDHCGVRLEHEVVIWRRGEGAHT